MVEKSAEADSCAVGIVITVLVVEEEEVQVSAFSKRTARSVDAGFRAAPVRVIWYAVDPRRTNKGENVAGAATAHKTRKKVRQRRAGKILKETQGPIWSRVFVARLYVGFVGLDIQSRQSDQNPPDKEELGTRKSSCVVRKSTSVHSGGMSTMVLLDTDPTVQVVDFSNRTCRMVASVCVTSRDLPVRVIETVRMVGSNAALIGAGRMTEVRVATKKNKL